MNIEQIKAEAQEKLKSWDNHRNYTLPVEYSFIQDIANLETPSPRESNVPGWVKDGSYTHHLHVVECGMSLVGFVLKGRLDGLEAPVYNEDPDTVREMISELKALAEPQEVKKCCATCWHSLYIMSDDNSKHPCPTAKRGFMIPYGCEKHLYCSQYKPKPQDSKYYEVSSHDGKVWDFYVKVVK